MRPAGGAEEREGPAEVGRSSSESSCMRAPSPALYPGLSGVFWREAPSGFCDGCLPCRPPPALVNVQAYALYDRKPHPLLLSLVRSSETRMHSTVF